MTPEWLTAIGTLGTFAVIAASAIAALFQLRHMRGSNQIVALTEVRESLESEHFRAALRYVAHDFQGVLQDAQQRKNMMGNLGEFRPELEHVRTVANFFESTATLIRRGIIDRDLACDLWGYVVINYWNHLEPFLTNFRIARGNPALFENFELWAVLSKRWMDQHQNGNYPRGTERMPHSELWPETCRAKTDPR